MKLFFVKNPSIINSINLSFSFTFIMVIYPWSKCNLAFYHSLMLYSYRSLVLHSSTIAECCTPFHFHLLQAVVRWWRMFLKDKASESILFSILLLTNIFPIHLMLVVSCAHIQAPSNQALQSHLLPRLTKLALDFEFLSSLRIK